MPKRVRDNLALSGFIFSSHNEVMGSFNVDVLSYKVCAERGQAWSAFGTLKATPEVGEAVGRSFLQGIVLFLSLLQVETLYFNVKGLPEDFLPRHGFDFQHDEWAHSLIKGLIKALQELPSEEKFYVSDQERGRLREIDHSWEYHAIKRDLESRLGHSILYDDAKRHYRFDINENHLGGRLLFQRARGWKDLLPVTRSFLEVTEETVLDREQQGQYLGQKFMEASQALCEWIQEGELPLFRIEEKRRQRLLRDMAVLTDLFLLVDVEAQQQDSLFWSEFRRGLINHPDYDRLKKVLPVLNRHANLLIQNRKIFGRERPTIKFQGV